MSLKQQLGLALCGLALLGLSACKPSQNAADGSKTISSSNKTDLDLSKADLIEYKFGDKSVAPEYHRSRTYTLKPGSLRLVVDSYGDVISDTTVKIDQAHWDKTLEAVKKAKLVNKEVAKEAGCTGGTSRSLRIAAGSNTLFSGSVYICGGSTTGNMQGDYESVQDAMVKGLNLGLF